MLFTPLQIRIHEFYLKYNLNSIDQFIFPLGIILSPPYYISYIYLLKILFTSLPPGETITTPNSFISFTSIFNPHSSSNSLAAT